MCIKQDILAALSYFDIFDYPLTRTEIVQFLGNTYSQKEVTRAIHTLAIETWIYKLDEFYTLQNNYSLITRRRAGNLKARNLLKTAQKIAGFISGFPFVKGIAVSGSLSKNFADNKSDIDFFIITEKNKLWIARTIMMFFRKLTIPFNKQHWFCMNYFIDETMLEIEEKNIFTAVEIATLLPFRGIEIFQNFYKQNLWTRTFLPNHLLRVSYVEEVKKPFLRKLIEFLLRNQIGNRLDVFFMKWTASRYNQKRKNGKLNDHGLLLSLKTSRHYAKHDPEIFQKKVTGTYEKKIYNLFRRYENNTKSVL